MLRSFLKCALCGLRMHGKFRRGRKVAYYTCEINRWHGGLVPEDHPRMVYLREKPEVTIRVDERAVARIDSVGQSFDLLTLR